MLEDPVTMGLASGATGLAVLLSIGQILLHLRNYTEPVYQRYIIRIIFLVPFYGVTSWLSLRYRHSSIYFDVPRDCYEAWVIYNFMALCMAYVGGPGAVVVKMDGQVIMPSWKATTCCFPPLPVDGFLLRRCKQATLQFVLLKPILAAFTLITFVFGRYEDGNWSLGDGYVYVTVLYNICYTVALYGLLIFYFGTEELLHPYKPLLKLVLIKSVIFLTFWQSIVISMMASRFPTPEDSGALQDWIVCMEMLCSACMMIFAFPHTEYKIGGQTTGLRLGAIAHAISIQDVITDVLHQFNPNYKTYVLYTDGGPADNVKRKKYRAQGKKSREKHLDKMGEADANVKREKKARKSKDGQIGVSNGNDDEEGQQWTASTQGGFFGRGATANKLLGWLPGITERERKQAVLVDSDSDAGYDDDNHQDNQLDDKVLTDDTDSEDGVLGGVPDSAADIETGTGTRGNSSTNLAPSPNRMSLTGQVQSLTGQVQAGFHNVIGHLPKAEDSDDDDRML